MGSKKKILNQFSWVFFGNIVFALSQWIIIIVITNYGSQYDLGYYTYALALISPVFMFFSFDLRRVLATSNPHNTLFSVFFLNRLIHLILASVMIMIILIFLNIDEQATKIVMLLTLFKFVEYISDIIFGYFQQNKLQNFIGKSQFLRGVFSTIIFSITFVYTNNLIIALFFLNFTMIIRLLLFDLPKVDFKMAKLNVTDLIKNIRFTELLKANFILGLMLFASSLIVNIPKYYLEISGDVTLVGYFSAIYYILTAFNLVITPVTTMIAPYLRSSLNDSKRALKLLVLKSIFLVSLVSSVFVIIVFNFTEEILSILYNESFLEYELAFKILMSSVIFSFINGILGLVLITLEKKKMLFTINMINLLITLTLGYYIIEIYNITGASILVLISRIITFLLSLTLILIILKDEK